MIETIRLFPTVQASGYPDKRDLAQAKLEKQHEMNKTVEVAKQKLNQNHHASLAKLIRQLNQLLPLQSVQLELAKNQVINRARFVTQLQMHLARYRELPQMKLWIC